MSLSKPAAVSLSGDVDELEASFYEAMQAGDIDRLMACWADEDDIVCVHPGGPRLLGAGAIRAVYELMFGSSGGLAVKPERLRKIESLTSSVHSVVERLTVRTPEGESHALVIATNVYQKTAQGWRMVVHHVSPGGSQDSLEGGAPEHVLLH